MRLFITYLLICVSCSAMSQTNEEKIALGDMAFADGDYYSASGYYYSVLKEDSSDYSVAFKYAEACRLFYDYRNAQKWYAYVNREAPSSQFPHALFYLAMMNKSNGNYISAEKHFNEYDKLHAKENDFFENRAKYEVENYNKIKALQKDTLSILIEHLSENVNSPYSEFGALQLGDTSLIFSALRPNSMKEFESILPDFYLSKIYSSKNTIAGWSQGNEENPKINNKESNNASTAFSSDYKRMYFSRCNAGNLSNKKCNLYVSKFSENKWQLPEKLNESINVPGYSTTQPSVSELDKNTEVLYYSSDRPGGQGGMDIWYTVIKNGKYNDPVNLGSIINTQGDEITPFYNDKTKTLYFSSDWLTGLGGYDVFKSSGALNSWSNPTNMGFPLNTSYNDMYFTVNAVDTDGYFTSNRPGSFYIKGETCCNDIWSYEWQKPKPKRVDSIPPVMDTVDYEQNIKDLLPLTLYFHNDIPDPASRDTFTLYNYKTTLAGYMEMRETYEKEYSKGLKGNDKSKAVKDIDEFFDDYVATGFTKLQQMSDWLLRDLKKGRVVKITVKGYCSPLQTTEYNVRLAKRRISSLMNYFKNYDYGVFLKYLDGTSPDGGRLEIHQDPVGESLANKFVSDNPNDERNSIYSRAAALERKIQIIMYESEDSVETTIKMPVIKILNDSVDLGKVTEGQKRVFTYTIRNTGDASLIIAGTETDCGCTVTDFPKDPILPGMSKDINVLFDAKGENGIKNISVVIYSNVAETKTTVHFKADVIPAPVQKKEELKKQPKTGIKK